MWIDLGNPAPRDKLQQYEEFYWPIKTSKKLNIPNETVPSISFRSALESRKTNRQLKIINEMMLSTFLWLTLRCITTYPSSLGFSLSHRPAPASGSIHSISLLLLHGDEMLRYDPVQHALQSLNIPATIPTGLNLDASKLVESSDAMPLVFAAEPGKIATKYEHGNSLLWRDAGALIGHMALTASALNLAFCPLGITGEPWVSQLSEERKLFGVGMALLGSLE